VSQTPVIPVHRDTDPDGRHSSAATPMLYLDTGVVARRYRELADALPGVRLHYAVKANPAPAPLRARYR
jgi:diaminopimelate decarboxylase